MFLPHIDVSFSLSLPYPTLPLSLKSIHIYLGEDIFLKKKMYNVQLGPNVRGGFHYSPKSCVTNISKISENDFQVTSLLWSR